MEGRKDLVGLQGLETDYPSNSTYKNLATCLDVFSLKQLAHFETKKETFLDVPQGLRTG
jgi:hypothetical protein